MCGFAGVIAWDEKYRTSRQTLEKMSRAIAHRGPDGEGYHLTREHDPITPETPQVALAFRRLAILDPDPRSNQPFTIGPLTMVFNGEIYNFRDLRAEISKFRPDYAWRTTGDTEVLLMSYEVWREKCLDHLNGMFAIAIWDEQKKELFLARDRMGQKPLFYHTKRRDGFIGFASELSAIACLRAGGNEISYEGLTHYLQYGTRESLGMTCEFQEVEPSQVCIVRVDQTGRLSWSLTKYFRARGTPQTNAGGDETRRLVVRAVERQLISDMPLGVFLSGGIDSSVVAACARQFGPVRSFSISFDDPRYDESEYAKQVATHLGTEHTEFRVAPNVIEDLPTLVAVFGEPFADSSAIPTHYLARETRKHVKVALSGDGGDELFGGYDRYRAMRIAGKIRIPRPLEHVGSLLAAGHPKAKLTRAGRLLQALAKGGSYGERYARLMRIFDDETILQLLPNLDFGLNDCIARAFDSLRRKGMDSVRAALATDRDTYLPDDLLTKVDRCSMLHNLEVRSPFMDHELVQFAAGLTTDQLLKGGPKRMLREAFAKDLPDFVFKRKKMGFAVPIGEWFRGELRGMLRESLFAAKSFARAHFNMKVVERLVDEHEAERIDHSQRLYALLMLELWWQQRQR